MKSKKKDLASTTAHDNTVSPPRPGASKTKTVHAKKAPYEHPSERLLEPGEETSLSSVMKSSRHLQTMFQESDLSSLNKEDSVVYTAERDTVKKSVERFLRERGDGGDSDPEGKGEHTVDLFHDAMMERNCKTGQTFDDEEVAEAVKITNCEGKILNSKAEFRQPPIVRVRREVNVGV